MSPASLMPSFHLRLQETSEFTAIQSPPHSISYQKQNIITWQDKPNWPLHNKVLFVHFTQCHSKPMCQSIQYHVRNFVLCNLIKQYQVLTFSLSHLDQPNIMLQKYTILCRWIYCTCNYLFNSIIMKNCDTISIIGVHHYYCSIYHLTINSSKLSSDICTWSCHWKQSMMKNWRISTYNYLVNVNPGSIVKNLLHQLQCMSILSWLSWKTGQAYNEETSTVVYH